MGTVWVWGQQPPLKTIRAASSRPSPSLDRGEGVGVRESGARGIRQSCACCPCIRAKWRDVKGCSVVSAHASCMQAVVEAGFDHANAFLANGTAYDMLFLGYSPEVDARDGDKMAPFQHLSRMGGSVAETHDEFKCIYKLRRWLCTQAYVISHAAMYRWRNLTYDVQTNIPIDFFLSSEPGYSDSAYFTVRPMMGFQRYHKPAVGVIESDTHTGSSYEVFKFIPGVVYSIIEPQLYSAKAKIISPAECLPPAQSYTWEGLSRNLFRILSSSLVSNADFCFPFAEVPFHASRSQM